MTNGAHSVIQGNYHDLITKDGMEIILAKSLIMNQEITVLSRNICQSHINNLNKITKIVLLATIKL